MLGHRPRRARVRMRTRTCMHVVHMYIHICVSGFATAILLLRATSVHARFPPPRASPPRQRTRRALHYRDVATHGGANTMRLCERSECLGGPALLLPRTADLDAFKPVAAKAYQREVDQSRIMDPGLLQ